MVWDGEERRRVPCWSGEQCDLVTKHEHALFGNPDELTAEQLAAGFGGGLVAIVREMKKTSNRNHRLLMLVLALETAQMLGVRGIDWSKILSAVGKLFS